MEDKDILLLESLGYTFSEQGAILDKDGKFTPTVDYNGRVIESPASAEEYQSELDRKAYLNNINFSVNTDNQANSKNQEDIAIAKAQIQEYEKNPLYANIPTETQGTVYEDAFEELKAEKQAKGEFVHDSLDMMKEEMENPVYKDIEDDELRERAKYVDRKLAEIKSKDPDVDAKIEFASDESKGFIISSIGGLPSVMATPKENDPWYYKATFETVDFLNDISGSVIITPTGTGMSDDKLQEEYKELTEERRTIMKPVAMKRMGEVKSMLEELNAQAKDTDYFSTEYDKLAYAITTLEKEERKLNNFVDDAEWYEIHKHASEILNTNNIADWASLGLYEGYASYNYVAGLRDKMNNGEELDAADIALQKALVKKGEIESNNFQQNFVTEIVSGTNESLKFLGFSAGGRIASRTAARGIAKAGGKAIVGQAASVGTQVFLHPQTYSNAFNYYAGDFKIQTNENGETEIMAGQRLYDTEKRNNQLAIEELDKIILNESNSEKKLQFQKQRQDLINYDKSIKKPATYTNAMVYGVTEMAKEVVAENYGGKLFNQIGGAKAQQFIKNSQLGQALNKIPGVKGLNQMRSKGKDILNSKFGGVPGEKVIGSNTEEIFEEMLVQLTPTYGNTLDENLDQASELLTLDFYTKVAAQTLLMQKTMALGSVPMKAKTYLNKDERQKQKDIKELHKQLGNKNINQADFNKAMMKVGEGNFSMQEYNVEIAELKKQGLIEEANELERTKILKQAIAAEKSGNLSSFRKSMVKAKYNKNLSPETLANIQAIIPEIDAMVNTPYINRTEVIVLNSKKKYAEKSLNEIDKAINDINVTELSEEYSKIKEKIGADETYTLDDYQKSPLIENYLVDNYDNLSSELQKYLLLKSQKNSSKKGIDELSKELKTKTSYKHQMKLEIEQEYMKYLNDMNKQLFKGKMTPSQFKQFTEVKGVQQRQKGITKEDLERIHSVTMNELKSQQGNKVESNTTTEEVPDVDIAPKPQAVQNTLVTVAQQQAQQSSNNPSTDVSGNPVIDDSLLDDFLPASDETTNELKVWGDTFQSEENRKPTFQDFFNEAIEQVGKQGLNRTSIETLGDAFEKAGLGVSNWEKLYNENYIDRKSIVRNAVANAISDNTSIEEIKKENKETTEKIEIQGINPKTGIPLTVSSVKGKTTVVSTKANYRGLIYKDNIVDDNGTVTVNKEDTNSIPQLNEQGIIDVKALLHPEKNNPGSKWSTEILDESQWNMIPVSIGDTRKFQSFQQWVDDNKSAEMSLEEFKKTETFISKVPILYKDNEGNIVSMVADTDWYNTYNIKDPNKEDGDVQDLNNPTASHTALINKGKQNTLQLRKDVIAGKISQVEVISKSGGGFDTYPIGSKLPYLNQVGSNYPIVFMKGDELVGLDGITINNNDKIEVLNLDELKTKARKNAKATNRTKILIPVNTTNGKKKYIAYNVMGLNENQESQAFTEDIETSKYITAAHLRLQFGDKITGLEKDDFQVTLAQAKIIQSQIKEQTGLDIQNFNAATELVKTLTVFNYGNGKYTIDKKVKTDNGEVKASILMLKGQGKFTQNTSLSNDRKRVPLKISTVDGQIKVEKLADTYEEFLRSRLSTEIVHYNMGTEENPAWTAHAQPIIKLKPLENNETKSIEVGETGNSVKEEARETLKDNPEDIEAKEILGDTSIISDTERAELEAAEQYLRDMGTLDSDEDYDDLLPTVSDISPIQSALKNVGNLSLAQQRDISSYIMSLISDNYDASKVLSVKDFSKGIENLFSNYIEEKKAQTNSMISNMKSIQENSPSDRINNVITQLEKTLETINEVNDNFESLFKKAYLEAGKKGFIPTTIKTSNELDSELKESHEDEMYEKDYSKSSNEVIHKDKISKKLRRLFATINTGKKGFLGLPKHESYDTMYNTISALIVSDLPTNPDFDSMIQKLELFKESFPWLENFITDIKNADSETKNGFVYNMYKYAAKAKFVIFTKHPDGIQSELWNSNANNIQRKIKESWNNNFKRSNITNGSTLNTKKLESLYNEFLSWGDEPWNTDEKILRNWLSDFGIKLSNNTWKDLREGKMTKGSGKNKSTHSFDSLFFVSGNNRNDRLFSNLALFAKQHKDTEQGKLDYVQNANLHPYKDMNNIMKSLIPMEAMYNAEMQSMSRRDGGKTVSEIVFPNFFFHNIAKIIKDAQGNQEYIDTLLSIPFSSTSLSLQLLKMNDKFADIFDYAEVGLQSLDEQFKKSNPFGKIDQISPLDFMFHQRNQFQYMQTEIIDEQFMGFDLRTATMATLTNSDKGRMVLKKTAVFDLFNSTDSFKTNDDGSISFTEQLKELLYNQLVEPELNRIITHQDSNIKDYDKGAVRFNLFPMLNSIVNNDGISTLDFLDTSKDKDIFKEQFFDSISSFLQDSIQKEVNSNVAETSNFIEDNTDLFNNKNYLNDVRRKDTPENKMIIAELDYVINSMISNMDTLQTISGDPAFFYKSKSDNELKQSKDLGINLGKRMAMMIAPGSVLANSTNETYLQFFLKDQEEVANNAEEIIGWHYGKTSLEEQYNGKTYQALINELRNKTISSEDLSQLQLKFDKVKDFLQIETTDAQEYTTLKEHLRVLNGAGRLTDEQRDDILEKRKNDIPLDRTDIDMILQPIKPVYTGDVIEREIKDAEGNIIRPARRRIMYIKSSSFPLIPELVNGTKLEPLMRKMEEMEEEYNMTARASYQSANKVGAMNNPIDPFNEESLNTIDRLNPDTAELQNALVLDRINFKIQQDIPEKKGEVSMGTQIFKLLFGDGITEINGFELDGESINGKDLKNEFFNVFSTIVGIQRDNLLNELGLDNNYQSKNPEETALKIQSLLVAEAESRDFSENDIKSLAIEKKTIDNKDIYHFKLPLWFSGNSNKFESMLNAIINNKVFKQKLPGNSFVVGSEAGLTLREGIENTKDNKILYIGDYKGGELKGNEVLAPSKIRMNGKLINLFDTKKDGSYKYLIETDNSFELNTETIDPELFNNFTFRTPTSSHGSASNIKIVGFLPDVMGDLMITPKNFVTQMGQDFDIDKLTSYQFYHTIGENGRIEKLNESHKQTAINKVNKKLIALENQGAIAGNAGLGLSFFDDMLMKNAFTEEEMIEILELETQDVQDIIDKVAKGFDLKIAKNRFIEIHNSVYNNQSAQVQSKINKVLSMEVAENQADGIAALSETNKDETGFNILSPTYQMEKMISGSTGSSAIGIYAKGVTLNSLIQQADNKLRLLDENEDGEVITKNIRIGNIVSNGEFGRQNTLSIENANQTELKLARKIAEAQDERVNTATDNEKAQILGRVGITSLDAVAVDNLLSLLGIDTEIVQIKESEFEQDNVFHKKAIIDNKEVYYTQYSLPYLLHSQPIVKEYFKRLSNGNAIIKEYNADLIDQIKEDLIGDYQVNDENNFDIMFTGEKLAEQVANNNYVSDFQKEILLKYLNLIEDAKKLKELQEVVDMSNLGKSMWEAKDKIEKFKAIQSNSNFENISDLLGTFRSDVNELEQNELYIGEGIAFTPTTNQGVMVGNAISMARNLFYDYFPYYNPYISGTISNIINMSGFNGNEITFQEEIFQEMKKFITAANRNQLFLDTPTNERKALFISSDDNISLSSYISKIFDTKNKEFKAGLDMVQNNSLLSYMSYEKGENGKPDLIKFDNTEVTNASEDDFYDDFRELFIKDYSLPDKNGKPYSTRQLAQELVAYSHLSGGIIREAIEFHRFIPIEYYDSVQDTNRPGVTVTRLMQQYDPLVSDWSSKDRLKNFTKQFFQNNPQRATQLSLEDYNKEFGNIPTGFSYNKKLQEYPQFISVKNKTKSKLKNEKWSLFENTSGNEYRKIDVLGEFGMAEYDYNSSNLKTIVTSKEGNQEVVSKSIPVTTPQSIQVVPPTNDFTISETDSVIDVLKSIANNKFDYNSNLHIVAQQLYDTFKDKGLATNIVIDNDLPASGRYTVANDTITINPKKDSDRLAETFLHEFIHAITVRELKPYMNADGTQLNTVNAPKEIVEMNILFNKYSKEIRKKYPEETTKFNEKLKKWKNGDKNIVFTPRELSIFYPTHNMKEFLAIALSNNTEFIKEASNMKYAATNMNFMSKFAKIIDAILSKIEGINDNLFSKILTNSLEVIEVLNEKNTAPIDDFLSIEETAKWHDEMNKQIQESLSPPDDIDFSEDSLPDCI